MGAFTFYRTLSLMSLLILYVFLSFNVYLLALSALGLGHYVMSALYSRKIVLGYLQNKKLFLNFGLLILLSLALTYFAWPGLIVLFGIHHLFTEVYAPNTIYPREHFLQEKKLLIVRYIFHIFAYVLVVQAVMGNRFIVLRYEIAAFIATAITYFLFIGRSMISKKIKLDLFLAELTFFFLVLFSLWASLGFLGLLFYHFIFWFYFPLHKLKTNGFANIRKYLFETLIITGIILTGLSFIDAQNMREFNFVRSSHSLYYLKLFSYIHIVTALALSKMNPEFIQSLFSAQKSAKLLKI
jgi:hypothetical protein